jgi:translocator assembly and maintenance protein 41
MKAVLEPILKHRFPPVLYAFGYGSGVFKQGSVAQASGKMVDTIMVVENSLEWHEENRARNSTDYPWIPRYLMSSAFIEQVQRQYGGSMWFNTLVPCQTKGGSLTLKYGVIALDDFLDDCNHWTKLYVAGRLHKPVLELDVSTLEALPSVHEAILQNRQNALRAALALLMPRIEFPSTRLLEEIVNLSYGGDVRVGFAESPTKVKDITHGSLADLTEIYLEADIAYGLLEKQGDVVKACMDFAELVSPLPGGLSSSKDPTDLRLRLSDIVQRSSFTQTAKGFLTAGLRKSVWYGASKVAKRMQLS